MRDAATRVRMLAQGTTMLGTVIGGGGYIKDGERKNVLAMVNLDSEEKKIRLIFTSFLPHALTIDPNDPSKAAVFEKKGPGACYLDFVEGRVVAQLTSPKTRHFYGHGAYSPNGSLLYATESYLEDQHRGALIVRDAKTFQELGSVPTHGTAPHDCMLLDDGSTMVVTNGGGPLRGGAAPSVTYIDVKSEKLLEEVKLTAPRYNTGHLAISGDGNLAVVSAPRDGLPGKAPKLGAISLKPKGQPLITMRKPKKVVDRMKGETLSVLIHPREQDGGDERVLATHPDGDMLSVWSMRQGKLLRKYTEFEQPRGICLTLDGNYFAVSHSLGRSVALSFISTETYEPVPAMRVEPSYIGGSHIFAHQLAGAA